MSWTRTELKRSYPCNPALIKFLRERKNWSQKQLAKESGYCERLICKAESGGNISASTIAVLAKALSSPDMKIFPEDLISDPVALSKKFVKAAHTLQEDMIKAVSHFIAPDGVFTFVQVASGDYAGTYNGVDELDTGIRKFFAAQEFVADQDFKSRYRYYVDGNEVIVWGSSDIRDLHSGQTAELEITLRMFYEKGKLVRIEDRSDINQHKQDRKSKQQQSV